MDEKKILGLLGFAARARTLTVGVTLTCDAMREGGKKSPLAVAMAADASENTKKRMADRTAFYRVPLISLTATDSATLAAAVGKKGGAVGALGVTDPHLASAILAAAEKS